MPRRAASASALCWQIPSRGIGASMSSGQKGESSAVLADTRPDEGVKTRARRPSGGSTAVNATIAAAMGIQPRKIALSTADQRRVSRVSQMRANPASARPSAAEEELASLKEQQQALTRRISKVQEKLGLPGDEPDTQRPEGRQGALQADPAEGPLSARARTLARVRDQGETRRAARWVLVRARRRRALLCIRLY